MKNTLYLLLFCCTALLTKAQATIELDSTIIETSILTDDLNIPWEIAWGPDDQIWMTERNGLISTIDPETGERTALAFLLDVLEIQETGLLGLVLHPNFIETPQVFVVYTHYNQLAEISEKIVRFDFDAVNNDLINDTIIFQGIPGFDNHVGSRLVISPDLKLFVTTGDGNELEKAQDIDLLNGKTLRLNLDGSIPSDNPFGPDNPVWTYGHRNAQGLVLAPDGKLYSSEHGTYKDDEINEIVAGGNYGWSAMEGFCDLPEEMAFCDSVEVTEPLYNWDPTIAPGGLDFYQHPAIPEWQNTLILAVLKSRDIRVLSMDETQDTLIGGATPYLNAEYGRFRDLCFAPDGRIFLSTSNKDFYGDPTLGPDKIIQLQSDNAPPPYPIPNFILEADSCGLVNFTNLSTNAGNHEWILSTDTNQGFATLTEESPNFQFPFPAWYTIELKASNENFSNTKKYRLWIETCVNQPIANFDYISDCLDINFTNNTFNSNSENASYLWDFGDGNQSEELSPNYTYSTEGTYTVQLTVDNMESSDTIVQLIEVEDCIIDGILEFSEEQAIKIYPNPVKEQLWVSIPEGFIACDLEVLNAKGQSVYQRKETPFEQSIYLEMKGLNKGLYWLILKNKENNTIFCKFVVE